MHLGISPPSRYYGALFCNGGRLAYMNNQEKRHKKGEKVAKVKMHEKIEVFFHKSRHEAELAIMRPASGMPV